MRRKKKRKRKRTRTRKEKEKEEKEDKDKENEEEEKYKQEGIKRAVPRLYMQILCKITRLPFPFPSLVVLFATVH